MEYEVIYPEHYYITPEQVMIRAQDLYIDGDITEKPENPEHAAELLQDAGVITFSS